MNDNDLIKEAIEARKMAYAPYSGFMVGAALLTKGGRVYRGCNIESASYTPTNCAERTAFFKAVSEGETEFTAIAIVGAHKDTAPEDVTFFYPCGVCRQVMMEFCAPETFRVLVAKNEHKYEEFTLKDIFPNGFGPMDMQR